MPGTDSPDRDSLPLSVQAAPAQVSSPCERTKQAHGPSNNKDNVESADSVCAGERVAVRPTGDLGDATAGGGDGVKGKLVAPEVDKMPCRVFSGMGGHSFCPRRVYRLWAVSPG